MPKKISPAGKTVKTKSSSKKPVQETDAKIRALEEQLAHLLEENQQTFMLRARLIRAGRVS